MAQNQKLSIIPLDKLQHDRASFDCGHVDLNRFIREQAGRLQLNNVSATHVAIDATHDLRQLESLKPIVGFYSLAAHAVQVDTAPLTASERKRLPHFPNIPAVLLGQLAVDKRFQGQGIGGILLVDALQRSASVSKSIAAYAMIVEANSTASMEFYKKFGFREFHDIPNKLFLPLAAFDQT